MAERVMAKVRARSSANGYVLTGFGGTATATGRIRQPTRGEGPGRLVKTSAGLVISPCSLANSASQNASFSHSRSPSPVWRSTRFKSLAGGSTRSGMVGAGALPTVD